MEGLEISEVLLSEVRLSSYSQRIDSTFFLKEFLDRRLFKNCFSLNNICEIKSGTTPSCRDENLKEGVVLLKTNNIRNNIINFSSVNDFFFIDHDTHKKMNATSLRKNDVLMNIVGATTDVIGRCAMLGKSFPEANITQAMALLRIKPEFFKQVLPSYLFAYLTSKYGHQQVRRISRPTGQFNMNLQEVGSFCIPIPSIKFQEKVGNTITLTESFNAESERIYSQAETLLLSTLRINNFSPRMERFNIKSFKDSFVQSGRLDAEYYQQQYDDLHKELSKHNQLFRLGDRLTFNQRGSQPDYAEQGLPVVNSKHVQRGEVLLTDDNRYAEQPDKKKTVIIQKGDVLINGTGVGTIGRAAPYLYETDALPDNHVTVLRTKAMTPTCLALYLNSIAGQLQVDKYFKGSSGQIELYPSDIAEFWCPVIDQQTQADVDFLAKKSTRLKMESKRLLEVAKHAVEIAIEQDEDSALKFITKNGLM